MEGTAVNNETNCHDESCNESLVIGGSPENDDLFIECSHSIKKDDDTLVTENFSGNIENDDDSTTESNVEIDIKTSVNENPNNVENINENSVDDIVAIDDEGAVGEDVIHAVENVVIDDEGAVGEDVIHAVENVVIDDEGAIGGVVENIVAIDNEGAVGGDVMHMEINDPFLSGSEFQESVPLLDQYVNGLIELIQMDVDH